LLLLLKEIHMRMFINQSDLSADPEVAEYTFVSRLIDYKDPLEVLLDREARGQYVFHTDVQLSKDAS
jgi:hypothetical protein